MWDMQLDKYQGVTLCRYVSMRVQHTRTRVIEGHVVETDDWRVDDLSWVWEPAHTHTHTHTHTLSAIMGITTDIHTITRDTSHSSGWWPKTPLEHRGRCQPAICHWEVPTPFMPPRVPILT